MQNSRKRDGSGGSYISVYYSVYHLIQGWVKNVRKQKKVVFIDINDGSTAKKLQVVAPSDLLEGYNTQQTM